jgi:hypothetical protein
MTWSADIVSEPSRNHELCVDLFEGGVHRARIRRNERRELELVCYTVNSRSQRTGSSASFNDSLSKRSDEYDVTMLFCFEKTTTWRKAGASSIDATHS